VEVTASALSCFAQAMMHITAAQIELESMKVANEERRRDDKALAYDESAFLNLQNNMIENARSCIGWIL
jgi:hypothetical protein